MRKRRCDTILNNATERYVLADREVFNSCFLFVYRLKDLTFAIISDDKLDENIKYKKVSILET